MWSHRTRLASKRWSELVFWGFVGGGLSLLVAAWYQESLTSLGRKAPWWTIVLSALIAALVLCRWVYARLATAVRYSAYYPPLWIGVLVGVAVALILCGALPSASHTFGLSDQSTSTVLYTGAILAVSAFAIAIESLITIRLRSDRTPFLYSYDSSGNLPRRSRPFDLDEWIQTDTAVEECAHDVFDRERVVRRIALRLSLSHPPAQAVIGSLGSGKTTLRNFVSEELLRDPRSPRLVPVELWPFETSRAAVEGVLNALIESLSCDVSVLALKGVPGRYSEAMHASGGVLAGLANLLGSPGPPHKTLQSIDRVAIAIGRKYVVWIEDLERFAASSEHPSDLELDKLNPIRALLVGLDQLDSITVVTATTTLHTRFDVEKVARYVEVLPQLDPAIVGPILSKFRARCWASNIIDPALPGARGAFSQIGSMEGHRGFFGFGSSRRLGIGAALTELCATPRTLKHALRITSETWKKLEGEIDLDDVLVMNILRVGEPDAFALVSENIYILRHFGDNSDSTYANEQRGKADMEWGRALDSLACSELRKSAIESIVHFVFRDPAGKPQGFGAHRHVDYWQRFLAEPDLAEQERDQPILRAIVRDDSAILDVLDDPKRRKAIYTFHRQIEVSRIVSLLGAYVRRKLRTPPTGVGCPRTSGLVVICGIWRKLKSARLLPMEDVADQLFLALWRCASANPGLACKIEQLFVLHEAPASGNLLGREQAEYLQEHLRTCFFGNLGGPAQLAESLWGQQTRTLLTLVWGFDRVRAGDTNGTPFPEWANYRGIILEAAELEPESLLPQLAQLVVESMSRMHPDPEEWYEFDEARAVALFGSARAVFDVFAPHSRSLWEEDKAVQGVYEAMC